MPLLLDSSGLNFSSQFKVGAKASGFQFSGGKDCNGYLSKTITSIRTEKSTYSHAVHKAETICQNSFSLVYKWRQTLHSQWGEDTIEPPHLKDRLMSHRWSHQTQLSELSCCVWLNYYTMPRTHGYAICSSNGIQILLGIPQRWRQASLDSSCLSSIPQESDGQLVFQAGTKRKCPWRENDIEFPSSSKNQVKRRWPIPIYLPHVCQWQ